MLTVQVTSTYTSSERLISPEWTLEQLGQKLEQITGIPPAHQDIKVSGVGRTFDLKGHHTQLVGEFLKGDGIATLQVVDSRPADAQFLLDESVEKYEMSDLEYSRRQNTVLEWKKQNKLGRFGDVEDLQRTHEPAAAIVGPVGSRCIVALKSGDRPAGTISYVGKVAEIPGNGDWVGVALDTPLGKNDGTIKGSRYFTCEPNHGVFVKGQMVSALDLEMSDDEI